MSGRNESQCVFVKTSIDTRLALLLDSDDSVYAFKEKICKEHEQCFPSVGNITISALKVNLGGNDYHLSDCTILKTALQGLRNKDWFLSVDLVRVEEKGELQIGEVVEKKARKRKSKSDNKSIKKPSIETPTEAKGLESGEGNVTKMGENQHICDADQEGPVNGHTIDVEVKLDPVDGHTIDVEAKLDLSGTMEQETEMSAKEKDGDEEAKSEKPKKKKRAKKVKTPTKEDGLVASSSRNAEEDGVARDP
ncbi:COP1-interacting protein-like protein [Arabidopsis thaliana]|uniref:COP1-interacting protein-like protein n=1 Tax=Arabidopsis thaliana TaxID=3702 RepID=B3H6U0_ARATH|nr:COP1-interacting protein-like protein [Arabidopsis thaliana]AEC05500.1 COP1-interacting protein-like protein [Arabidopsis thaliana]|eukprot:NP_001118250.1 COP1-interacting protein-like protein [Arabidopsis thaliana]